MRNRTILLALAAVSAALFAMPAVASAGSWQIDWPNDPAKALTFTTTGGEALLTSGESEVKCTANKGTGKYTTTTTGEIELTFTGCTLEKPFVASCNSPNQAAGTITTNNAVFHNVYAEPNEDPTKRVPAIQITGPAAGFVTFNCTASAHIVVTGSIIGEITKPGCGVKSKTGTVNFTSSATGVQTWNQVTTSGTFYDLISDPKFFGIPLASETASEDAEGTISFSEEATETCV